MHVKTTLTVFFDDPFWVGVCERVEGNLLFACRIVFGAEPKDYQVYARVLDEWNKLKFSPPVPADTKPETKFNPKRAQRQAREAVSKKGAGTKSQEAIKLQMESSKAEGKAAKKARTEEEKQRLFELKQAKKKEKHKGH